MLNGQTYYGETGYLAMMRDVLERGVDVPDRTGVGSRALFDAKLIYPEGLFPFSTVRSAPLWMAFEEFWFFMRGETQTKLLEEKGIMFWKGNTTREFLDKRGLDYLDEGNMGQAYGHQWRSYNEGISEFSGCVVDQLKDTIETLKKDPYSRRIYTTFWNPSASQFMALTPCWHSHQFVVLPNEQGENVLHLKLFNRSLDTLFGLQFAVQQYKLYQMCVAEMLGFKCGALVCDLTQFHLYQNQLEYAAETLTRELGTPGEVVIKRELKTLDDMLSMTFDDIEVKGLEVNKTPYVAERPPMAA
jgi:thymidylate synthase